MKKSLVSILTLCCALAIPSACNKDDSTDTGSGGSSLQNKSIGQLRSFRKQIEYVRAHPGEKNDETLSLEEALWDVENHFNLTYSDVECYYDQIADHEFSLPLPVNSQQQVLVYDAVALYEEVINQARAAMEADAFDNKGFLSLTVKEINQEDRGTVVTFSGKTGNRTNYNPPINHVDGPFGADDNWMFAAPLGKCDDPDIPSGADEQFQENLYIELIEPFIEAGEGCRNIYLDRQRFVFDGSNYAGLYYSHNTEDLCIDYPYMNDHYAAEKRTITQVIPGQYQLSGYSPISIEISGVLTEDGTAATHYNEVEYGIRAQVRIDEFGTIERLIP